jgi:AraC family transcriptional regulator
MKPVTRSFYREVVQRAVEHVAGRLDDALELDALAQAAGLSPFHFHRIFRGMVGETPLTLSRRLRLERAAWRLAHGDQGVTSIAFDAGYDTHEGFTRAFRAAYASSPSGFRQRKYPRVFLAASSGVHFDPTGQIGTFQPKDSGGASMNVEIKAMPELRVASVRHIGPYNQIPQACERLGQLVDDTELVRSPVAAMIAIYHDDPEAVPPDQLRSDAALIVPESAVLPAGLTEQRIPKGLYACTSHVGPYELLGDVWARFMGEWLPQSGHRLGPGPSYELYRNTPGTVPTEKLRTELYLPLHGG